ncbi:MAG TPA: TIGR03067 domain-containing protein, partial [Urbifossiella sp.]|nr:TIGR03067 domain-containing protein [Urbifossiella sp.]
AAALDLMQPTLTFTADKVTGKAAGAMPKEFMGFAVAQKIITPELAAIAEQGGEGVYHLDPTKSPKTIDIVTLGGARKTALGLYQLDGDTLKLCLSLDPAKVSERPKEFGSREGEGRVVVTLQRVPAAELPGSPNRTFALPKGPDPIPPPAPKP